MAQWTDSLLLLMVFTYKAPSLITVFSLFCPFLMLKTSILANAMYVFYFFGVQNQALSLVPNIASL